MASVSVDGARRVVATVDDPALAMGQVAFGAATTGVGGQGEAQFANAEIRSR